MKNILTIIEIIVAVLLGASILLQSRGADAGSIFGGGGGDTNVYTIKRGAERVLFFSTVILSILFMGIALAIIFFA